MTAANRLAAAAAQACHDIGTVLHAEPGWRTRGHGSTPVTWRAVMLHDTVTDTLWSRQQVTNMLIVGHTRLPGPIANVQLERNGDAVLIAAGRAYHAGPGSWPGIGAGNLHTIGVEAANAGAGSGERWTDAQRAWAVAFARAADLPVGPIGHREWTARKVDPWSLDMDAIRRQITDLADPWEQLMADLTDTEAARLKELAAYLAGENGTAGHSFARQTLRWLRDDSADLRELRREIRAMGSSPRGLVRYGVAAIRLVRELGYSDRLDQIVAGALEDSK